MARSNRLSPYRTTWQNDAFTGCVTYVKTKIVEWKVDFSGSVNVTLNSGGWRTVTTKRKMTQAARQFNLGYNVYQKKGDWFVDVFHNGRDYLSGHDTFDFYDGITIRCGAGFPLIERAA